MMNSTDLEAALGSEALQREAAFRYESLNSTVAGHRYAAARKGVWDRVVRAADPSTVDVVNLSDPLEIELRLALGGALDKYLRLLFPSVITPSDVHEAVVRLMTIQMACRLSASSVDEGHRAAMTMVQGIEFAIEPGIGGIEVQNVGGVTYLASGVDIITVASDSFEVNHVPFGACSVGQSVLVSFGRVFVDGVARFPQVT